MLLLGRRNLLCEQSFGETDVRGIGDVHEVRWYRWISSRHETDRECRCIARHCWSKIASGHFIDRTSLSMIFCRDRSVYQMFIRVTDLPLATWLPSITMIQRRSFRRVVSVSISIVVFVYFVRISVKKMFNLWKNNWLNRCSIIFQSAWAPKEWYRWMPSNSFEWNIHRAILSWNVGTSKKPWKWVWTGRYEKDTLGRKIKNIVRSMAECYKQIQPKCHNERKNEGYHRWTRSRWRNRD